MKQLYVGQYAMTPQQMERAGIIKPGSASLVNSLIESGADPNVALPPAIFTGKPGAENFKKFITTPEAQNEAVIKNLQVAQTSLQNTGLITGSESSDQIGGLIMSTALNGVDNVLDTVKNAQIAPLNTLTNNPPNFTDPLSPAVNAKSPNKISATDTLDRGATQGITGAIAQNVSTGPVNVAPRRGKLISDKSASSALKDIASGNYASKLNNTLGGLEGMATSVEAALNSTLDSQAGISDRGAEADAIEAIKQSIPTLKAYEPADLTVISKAQEAAKAKISALTAKSNLTKIGQNLTNKLVEKSATIGMDKFVGGKQIGVTPNINNPLGNVQLLPNKGSIASSLISAAKGGVEELERQSTSFLDAAGGFVPTGGFTNVAGINAEGLENAAQTLSSGLLSTTSGALASGLQNLPGGEAAFASITNFATGNLPELPGTDALKASLYNTASDFMNNLPGPLAGNTFSEQSLKDGLMSAVTSKLPSGVSAILKSAVGSLKIGGSGTKAPSVGVNTAVDRPTLNNGVKEILEDPGIPAPTYGEVDKAAIGKIEEKEKRAAEFIEKSKEINKELIKANAEYRKASDEALNAQSTLPQGDFNIGIAEAKVNIATQNREAARQKLKQLYQEYPEFSTQQTNNTVSNSTTQTTGKPVARILSGDSSTGIGSTNG